MLIENGSPVIHDELIILLFLPLIRGNIKLNAVILPQITVSPVLFSNGRPLMPRTFKRDINRLIIIADPDHRLVMPDGAAGQV